jgi:hypothetical protein
VAPEGQKEEAASVAPEGPKEEASSGREEPQTPLSPSAVPVRGPSGHRGYIYYMGRLRPYGVYTQRDGVYTKRGRSGHRGSRLKGDPQAA